MASLSEQMEVQLAEGGPEAVGVVVAQRGAALDVGLDRVPVDVTEIGLEQPARTEPGHVDRPPVVQHQTHGGGVRPQGQDGRAVGPEDAVGVGVLPAQDAVDLTGPLCRAARPRGHTHASPRNRSSAWRGMCAHAGR